MQNNYGAFKNRHIEILEDFKLIASDVEGFPVRLFFKKGETLSQVKTQIGWRRKLTYVLKDGHCVGLNKQPHKQVLYNFGL